MHHTPWEMISCRGGALLRKFETLSKACLPSVHGLAVVDSRARDDWWRKRCLQEGLTEIGTESGARRPTLEWEMPHRQKGEDTGGVSLSKLFSGARLANAELLASYRKAICFPISVQQEAARRGFSQSVVAQESFQTPQMCRSYASAAVTSHEDPVEEFNKVSAAFI